jgi:hypothetical protein
METAGFRELILRVLVSEAEAIERLFREVTPFV